MFKETPIVKVLKESKSGDYVKLEIEPLIRGFGHTLGNGLRRVLLSVLPGVAPSYVSIRGVTHEFSTLEGVREDITDIVLNMKGIIARFEECSSKTVLIDVIGPKNVVAGDIQQDSEIEILNSDLPIATINEGVRFVAEITFTSGSGYVSCEQNRQKMEEQNVGVIPIDSIYTPIKKVNVQVSNTRVGKSTDFDKLILEVWSNKSISAKEAVTSASAELINHYKLFSDLVEIDFLPQVGESKQKDFCINPSEITIDELDLSVRAYNSLRRAGISNLYSLGLMSKNEISKIRNLGRKSFDEVIDKLVEYGYVFNSDHSEVPIPPKCITLDKKTR